jgi:hypothetical protein
MQFTASTRLLVFALSFATLQFALPAHADEGATDSNPYSFMGLCESQGSFTQEALQQTQRIRTILRNLKDNPACGGVNKQMEGLLGRMESQTAQAGGRSKIDSLVSLRRELGALASYSKLNTSMKPNALEMIVEKSLTTAQQKQSELLDIGGKNILDRAQALANLGMRADRTIKASLDIFNEVIDKVPQARECLDDASMGAFMGASVKLLSTFAFDNNNTAGLSTSISKLFGYMRDVKYAKALRKLNETEFRQSLSCLLEVTTENYCATEDAKALLNMTARDLQIRAVQRAANQPGSPGQLAATNPLSGFMIASTHIPNITSWLLNVQVGIKPQNKDDANNKNMQLENITTFFQMMNVIQGQFSENKLNLRTYTDPRSQQTYVLKSLTSLANTMMNDFGDKKENYFRTVTTERELPFLLLGFDKTPDDVLNGRPGQPPMDPYQYILANKDTILSNPTEVMNTIETNLGRTIERANVAAIQTYNRWLIADPAVIAMSAAASAPHSVLESFRVVDAYLGGAYARLQKIDSDEVAIMLPAIQDTRARIQTVLAAFQQFRSARNLTTEQQTDLFAKIVEIAYYQFNILLSRAGFLSERLNQVVYFDFVTTMRNNPNISKFEKSISDAGFKWSFDRIVTMSDASFSSVDSDLKNASRVNLSNLQALEIAFKGSWQTIIARARLEWQQGSANGWSQTGDSVKHVFSDPIGRGAAMRAAQGKDTAVDHLTSAIFGAGRLLTNRGTYPLAATVTRNNPMAREELFFLYSQYCTQALAFAGWQDFANLCKDANLTPSYLQPALRTMKPPEAAYYQVPFVKTGTSGVVNLNQIDPARPEQSNTYRRVCALRDYHRRNNILTKIIQESNTTNARN